MGLRFTPDHREAEFKTAPFDWPPTLLLILTPIAALILVPWYGLSVGYSVGAVVTMLLFIAWNGLGITAGYHRLWSHKTYDAHWSVRLFLLIGGTMGIQNTVFEWCSGHRIHHQHVDDPYQDPYAATRGFWHSHILWMFKSYPTSRYDFKNIKDLKKDPMLRIQERYYLLWIVLANLGLPALVGFMIGDLWGTLLLAGLLRLVICHHVTFFINSLAHTFGKQPYTDTNTACDNPWLAFLTWGEGYHNYHHIFQYDYRNGIKWWQYDPTKWLISVFAKMGLATNLKRVPNLQIKQAELAMKFKRAEKRFELHGYALETDLAHAKELIEREYASFLETLENWKQVKEQAFEAKKNSLQNALNEADTRIKLELELIEKSMVHHAHRLEAILKGAKLKLQQV